MEMKVGKAFYMLYKKSQGKEKGVEVLLYDDIFPAIEKIREYIKKNTSSELIQLTEISVTDEGMKALAVPWNKITEILVKKSSKI